MRRPVVELSDCILCGICVDVCPEVFRNTEAGFIEVIGLQEYPGIEVDEAINNCPEDCITWEEP